MVAKRGTRAKRVKSLKTKSLSSKKSKGVKGGAIDSYIYFREPGSQADSPSPQINWGDGKLKGKI
jgi:hypothetical protein